MLVVSWFICGFLYFFLYSYLFCKLVCKENFKINKTIIASSIIIGMIYYFTSSNENIIFLRPYILHLYTFLSLLFLYKKGIVKTLIGILIIVIIVLASEFIYDLFLQYGLKVKLQEFYKNVLGYLLSNVIIFLISMIIVNIKNIKSYFKEIISWYSEKSTINSILISFLLLTMAMFILYNNFSGFLPSILLLFMNIFSIGVIVFVIGYFKEKSNNNRIIIEYDQLLKYVNKYEKVVEDKSKRQHEYKNQLVLIKGMISKTNKKAIEYIDSLYEEEKDDSNLEMLKKLQYLPSGGLKGLIYYKLEDMKDKKINVFVDISPKVKNVKVNKKLDSNLKDISKVIGVYLDNAIEASIKSKEKYIVLEIYLEKDEWVFSLSNTYKGEINLSRIDKEGYTTKGSGKGYGLSLVKDIIEHNSDLRQERELRGIYYTQKLYMKK